MILRVDVPDRTAALDLSERLSGLRSYPVQYGRDSWYVAVDPDGDPDRTTAALLDELESWLAETGGECVLHHGERTYPLRAPVG